MSLQAAFTSFPELKSERLLLRQVETGDAPSLFAHFSTLRGEKYWDLEHRSVADARQHIGLIHKWYREQRLLWWAITVGGDPEVVGSCSLYDFEQESRAEIGYWLSTRRQGQGLATEAVRAVVTLGLGSLGLHRIQASCHPENAAAIAVVTRCGFQQEGLLREYEPGRDGWRDCLLFSRLKSDAAPL